jgi:hypothetical protein
VDAWFTCWCVCNCWHGWVLTHLRGWLLQVGVMMQIWFDKAGRVVRRLLQLHLAAAALLGAWNAATCALPVCGVC